MPPLDNNMKLVGAIIGFSFLFAGYSWITGQKFFTKSGGGSEVSSTEEVVAPPQVIFEKEESWGPCPSEDANACRALTKLSSDGNFVREGAHEETSILDESTIATITAKIQSLFQKSCPAQSVADYSAKYTLTLGNKTKVITFPGCQGEMKQIEVLLGF